MQRRKENLKSISADDFFEQVMLGAEIQPQASTKLVGVQVGRLQFVCDLNDLTEHQRLLLQRYYRAKRLRFGHPGDFIRKPFFFRCPLNTVRVTP